MTQIEPASPELGAAEDEAGAGHPVNLHGAQLRAGWLNLCHVW